MKYQQRSSPQGFVGFFGSVASKLLLAEFAILESKYFIPRPSKPWLFLYYVYMDGMLFVHFGKILETILHIALSKGIFWLSWTYFLKIRWIFLLSSCIHRIFTGFANLEANVFDWQETPGNSITIFSILCILAISFIVQTIESRKSWWSGAHPGQTLPAWPNHWP